MSLTPDEIRALRDPNRRHSGLSLYAVCDTALALYERNEALEAVVRALAESDPVAFDGPGRALCALCDENLTDEHAPSCPWRMARELTEGAG